MGSTWEGRGCYAGQLAMDDAPSVFLPFRCSPGTPPPRSSSFPLPLAPSDLHDHLRCACSPKAVDYLRSGPSVPPFSYLISLRLAARIKGGVAGPLPFLPFSLLSTAAESRCVLLLCSSSSPPFSSPSRLPRPKGRSVRSTVRCGPSLAFLG